MIKKWADWPIKRIALVDRQYPKILKKIPDAPKTLFFRGELNQKIFEKSLAVVGTRRVTQYGQRALEQLIPFLVAEKVTIISGFMYGVDTLAHQKCLECGGLTLAVFGCGLDIVYPPENEKLYSEILNTGGGVVSEYPAETKPQLWTFPYRNRIVAGLASLGVLIVEAGEKSGSLITAGWAKKQGKKVFAVPGPITSSTSAGTNLLIQQNQAQMVLSPYDILNIKRDKTTTKIPDLDPTEQKIFQALTAESLTADEIGRIINKNVSETGKILTFMLLRSIVAEAHGKYYLTEN